MSINPNRETRHNQPEHDRIENAPQAYELPSLDKTGRPEYHQADDEAPVLTRLAEMHDDKKSHTGVKVGAGIVATALLAGGAYLGMNSKGNSHEAKATNPSATAPTTPGESHPSSPSPSQESADSFLTNPDINLTNTLDSRYYNSLTTPEKAEVKKLHDMSLTDFEQQPDDTRRMYAQFVLDAYRGYTADYMVRNQNIITDSNDQPQYFKTEGLQLTPASKNATPQQIMQSNYFAGAIAEWAMTKEGDESHLYNELRPDAIKALSGVYTSTSSEVYSLQKNFLNSMDSLDANGGFGLVTIASANRSTENGKETIQVQRHENGVASTVNGHDGLCTLSYATFKNIKGEQVGSWLIDSDVAN